MNTYAPAQKRQHDATALPLGGTGKQRPVAGVGLPLFMQADAAVSATGATLQRQCACPRTSSANDAFETCNSGKFLQAKLTIGASDDPLELEADRVAEQVLAVPARTAVGSTPMHIQRFTGSRRGETATAPDSVDRVLAGSGRPLEPALQQDMEQRFGHDFSQVRVHADGAAEQSARDVNANAYTVGHDIVFGEGRFAPETHEGQRLIAHELTHVVQQSKVSPARAERSNGTTELSSSSDTAASPAAELSVPTVSGLSYSHIAVQRAAPVGRGAAAPPDPVMISGSLVIDEKPLTVVQQGGQILANSMGFQIAKPFTVSASAQVHEPSTTEPFEYGLVQNVFFDHVEEVFSEGDMLIDSVGPMVDSERSTVPFIHANAKMPTSLFAILKVGPSFTDIPSLEVSLKSLHCKKNKTVDLRSVVRSMQFRVGLVARGLKSGRLVPLGAIQTTYGFKSQVDFIGSSFKSTDASNLSGSYPLSSSASPVITDGTIGNEEGQAALNAETANFEERCENVP